MIRPLSKELEPRESGNLERDSLALCRAVILEGVSCEEVRPASGVLADEAVAVFHQFHTGVSVKRSTRATTVKSAGTRVGQSPSPDKNLPNDQLITEIPRNMITRLKNVGSQWGTRTTVKNAIIVAESNIPISLERIIS